MAPFDPSAHVGEVVTIRGTAYDGAAGALVELDEGTPIYIVGLPAWSTDLANTPIEVTGELCRRPSRLAAVHEPAEHSHGLGETFALDDASWMAIE